MSILTLLDLSAAFDTIDHSILLTRLISTFGIRDLALSFFRYHASSNCEWNKIHSFTSDLWDPASFRLGTSSLHSVYSASF